MIFVLLAALAIGGVAVAKFSDFDSLLGLLGMFLTVIGGIAFFVAVAATIDAQISFAPDMQKMAQTRSAVERLGCSASEDVIGTANSMNAMVQSARIWNSRWYSDPMVNNGVDTVTLIVIPECR